LSFWYLRKTKKSFAFAWVPNDSFCIAFFLKTKLFFKDGSKQVCFNTDLAGVEQAPIGGQLIN